MVNSYMTTPNKLMLGLTTEALGTPKTDHKYDDDYFDGAKFDFALFQLTSGHDSDNTPITYGEVSHAIKGKLKFPNKFTR